MDNIIEQMSKMFSHLAREIQIYFISGFIFVIEIFIIFDLDLKNVFNMQGSILEYIAYSILLYIIGQCVFSVYNFFYKDKIEKINNIKAEDIIEYEVNIFAKENKLYSEFIERYNILKLMRYNIGTTFIIMSIISIFNVVMIIISHEYSDCFRTIILSIFNILAGIFMIILANNTNEEFIKRLKYLNEYAKSKK